MIRPLLLIGLVLTLAVGLGLYGESRRWDPEAVNREIHETGTFLKVAFAHADHVEQSCVTCHHDYVDDSGTGTCFDCHRTDERVAALLEAQFHSLCRGCHEDKQMEGVDHGPTRQCVSCHIEDDRP